MRLSLINIRGYFPVSMDSKEIVAELRAKGHRITFGRELLLQVFLQFPEPFAAADILRNSPAISKATLYRQLDFFVRQKVLREVDFHDGQKRYELRTVHGHHHHLVCLECAAIEHVAVENVERELHLSEEQFSREKNFRVSRHALEFFGYCAHCQ